MDSHLASKPLNDAWVWYGSIVLDKRTPGTLGWSGRTQADASHIDQWTYSNSVPRLSENAESKCRNEASL